MINSELFKKWMLREADDQFASALDPASGAPSGAMQPGQSPPQAISTRNDASMKDPSVNVNNQPDQMGSEPKEMPEEPFSPDIPEPKEKVNFISWRNQYYKEIIKGDPNKLIDMINQIRDDDLDPYQRKFVEDNLQVQFLRQISNIEACGTKIRKAVVDQLDPSNPSNTITNQIINEVSQDPKISNTYIRLVGMQGMKGDLHRKFTAALLDAVQVGSGGQNEDLIFQEKNYSIKISTRFNNKFGNFDLGNWTLVSSDAKSYLSSSELDRMETGAPEERDVLRKRVIIESISSNFKKRAFLINSVDDDGTIYFLGLDLSNAIRHGYDLGKFNIKIHQDENSPASIDNKGQIVDLYDIKVVYQKATGEVDEAGYPITKDFDFLVQKDGVLYLDATTDIVKEVSSAVQGINFQSIPYTGNPSDIPALTRCRPSVPEILMRSC